MVKKRSKHIVAVVTSTERYENAGYRTGLWLGELTHFYDVAVAAGHRVTIASIAGGSVPIDPESLSTLVLADGGTSKRYADPEFMALLDDTVSVDDVDASTVDAVYLTGGHGTMFDFPTSVGLAKLIEGVDAAGGIVAAVCHGPSGLLHARRGSGKPFLKGRKVTGFSWPEEKLAKRADAVPFRLDEALKRRGAKYTKAVRPFASKVVVDGTLVTGQNPGSAAAVGAAVVKLLKRR